MSARGTNELIIPVGLLDRASCFVADIAAFARRYDMYRFRTSLQGGRLPPGIDVVGSSRALDAIASADRGNMEAETRRTTSV